MAPRRAMGNRSNLVVVTVSNPVAMAVVASSHPPIMLPLTAVPRQLVATVNPLVAMVNRRNKC